MRFLLALTLLLLAATAGCGSRGEPRSFHLASTSAQAVPGSPRPLQLLPRDLSEDVDVVAIHQDYLGVPWGNFQDDLPPPTPWVEAIDALVEAAGEAPVYLALALVNGEGRAYLDADVGPTGTVEEEWSPICFDFARDPNGDRLQRAYIDYALWMIDRFQPRWFNLGIELNHYLDACDDRTWASLVQTEVAVYRAIKAHHPELVVFPSLDLELLYGLDPTCTGTAAECLAAAEATFEARLVALEGLEMDRLALKAHPFSHPSMSSPAEVPADYFSRIASRMPQPLLLVDTGWPAGELRYAIDPTTGPCVSYLVGSPEDQAAYLRRVVAETEAQEGGLLTWWSNRDLLPAALVGACSTIAGEYDCGAQPDACQLILDSRQVIDGWPGELALKLRGVLGLRDHEGQAREPMATAWSEQLGRRLRDR